MRYLYEQRPLLLPLAAASLRGKARVADNTRCVVGWYVERCVGSLAVPWPLHVCAVSRGFVSFEILWNSSIREIIGGRGSIAAEAEAIAHLARIANKPDVSKSALPPHNSAPRMKTGEHEGATGRLTPHPR